MMGTMISAAVGSAHHHPNAALSKRPASKIADRYTQKSVCLASACIAALPNCSPTFFLARDSRGMATREAHAKMIPGTLRSGAPLDEVRNCFKADVG